MRIVIDLISQQLSLIDAAGFVLKQFHVSTALNGAGERRGSFQTPRGAHVIRAVIGADAPVGAVFRARRPTGEVYSADLAAAHPERDWILTRIIWLSGEVPGFNRLGGVDTMARYIYIHGTPDSEPMGLPASHGCIRMRNADLVALFEMVKPGVEVDIVPPDDADWPVYPVRAEIGSEDWKAWALPGPVSPVANSGCFTVGRTFALWQPQGCCEGMGGLAGGTAWLRVSDQGVWKIDRLLAVLVDEARALGWCHLDVIALTRPTTHWVPVSEPLASEIGPVRRYRYTL
ncbi:L,D-transpeptidase [Jeongeupia naejangsanensis]|uniref:L,D-transpeptidase n=2 Tax=Jeongeupia naejangsanensis TaxID=613195 RepID=A0ABS2BEZ4_9NEIS|nr:L,D-transpeptidase [Jeongeupia naejangsanensis]MBM3114194.1 L,D-transpeptidase [Jeongeupia naejangsanensis]